MKKDDKVTCLGTDGKKFSGTFQQMVPQKFGDPLAAVFVSETERVMFFKSSDVTPIAKQGA